MPANNSLHGTATAARSVLLLANNLECLVQGSTELGYHDLCRETVASGKPSLTAAAARELGRSPPKTIMSVDLFVKFTSLPSDVKSKWESALSTLGFEVEFHPDFDSVTWLGGLLPARMLAVDPALQTNYGKLPIIAGFELYLSKDSAHLTTSMGRTMADLRLQCLAAATLASITDGKYEDPQEGKSYSGDKALKIALKHIRNYESGANQTGARWYELFESWNPTDEP